MEIVEYLVLWITTKLLIVRLKLKSTNLKILSKKDKQITSTFAQCRSQGDTNYHALTMEYRHMSMRWK